MFRQCAAAALGRRRRFRIIGEAADLRAAMIRANRAEPDVVVAQIDPPIGAAELDGVRELASAGRAVLVLSAVQAGEVSQLLKAGARGYLDDSRELQHLEQAIDQIHAGGDIVVATAPGRAEFFVGQGERVRTEVAPPVARLTERELDVLRLVVLGHTNGEIARELCITEHTAKGHLAKILSKLGLNNRVQVAAYALRHRLVEPVQPAPGTLQRASVEPPA
jgi:DNA-binding NarL/FixJ family response regulator